MTGGKSSGLIGAFREVAFDFFEPEPNEGAESDERQFSEPCLFPDPCFRNSETLGEFGRTEQAARVTRIATVALAQNQGKQYAFEGLEGSSARRDLSQDLRQSIESEIFRPCRIGNKLVHVDRR